jgi:simple sugar transport system ATP-binding protein
VEICRLLYQNVQIIILDEPTSVLTDYEAASFFTTLKNLARAGKSLILITHKLKEIKLVSDRVSVLRKGELVGVRETAETDEHDISRMMMGIENKFTTNQHEQKKNRGVIRSFNNLKPEQVVVFDNVTVLKRGQKRPLLDGLSFAVHSGEVLGFAGVAGNGLGALEAALGGFLHPMAGKILHRGKDISALNIRRLRNQGLAYIPADRLGVGSAPAASVDENLAIGRSHEFYRSGFLDLKLMRNFTNGVIERFNIEGALEGTAMNGSRPAASLSGGNLQKLILGREIDQYRDYIVFSEPTWGLDIAAAGFVRGEIAALRERGAAVILISTNLEEVLSLADRIIVMYRGKKAGEFINAPPRSVDELYQEIGDCMQGLGIEAQV